MCFPRHYGTEKEQTRKVQKPQNETGPQQLQSWLVQSSPEPSNNVPSVTQGAHPLSVPRYYTNHGVHSAKGTDRQSCLQLSATIAEGCSISQFQKCKSHQQLVRTSQENSTNSNRKSKCPLQTCTRYEAMQRREKIKTG